MCIVNCQAIDKTNRVQEKNDLTYRFLGDKVQQALGISGEMHGKQHHDRGPFKKTEGGFNHG